MSGPERKWMKGQGPYRIKMSHSGRRGRQGVGEEMDERAGSIQINE